MLLAAVGIEKTKKSLRKAIKLKEPSKRRTKLSRFAIIDLGTNSVRLDVYKVEGARIVRIYRGKSMVRLGDGVFRTGRLSKEVMKRTTDAFIAMRLYLDQIGIDSIMAFGTSALRSASNSKSYLSHIHRETGIRVQIISGLEEARLIAKGILANEAVPKGRFALVDIGGGSTEISICQGKKVLRSFSFRLGANRLKQMFYKDEGKKNARRHRGLDSELALRQYVRDELFEMQNYVRRHDISLAIGSSGTIRTLGRILKKMGCKTNPAHRTDLSALVGEIKGLTRTQIMAMPGLESKRVDLIVPGAILIEEILYSLNTRQLKFTEYALRDGLLYSILDGR